MNPQRNPQSPPAHAVRTAAALLLSLSAALLGGCASAPPSAIREQLDERTGTTITSLGKPLQLLAQQARGPGADPFAFVGSFETNRMGQRKLYLWLAVPNENRSELQLSLSLDAGQPFPLGAAVPQPSAAGLARYPYDEPTPWSVVQAFEMDDNAMRLLAAARRIQIDARYSGGTEPVGFTAEVEPADLFARFQQALGL